MIDVPSSMCRSESVSVGRRGRGCLRTFAAAALVIAPGLTAAQAEIFGTLSNFDCYFTSPDPVGIPGSEGAEIELEGVHSSSVGGDYPAHYSSKSITEYTDSLGNFLGTRIRYTGYNFSGAPTPGSLLNNPNPTSTNGHQLTYTAGGEHFGFWLNGAQPTAQRFFWLDDIGGGNYARIGDTPVPIPGPTWNFVPPAGGGQPVVQAVVRVPEPVEPPDNPEQRPDSIWMKVYKVKLSNAPQDSVEMQELLLKLISDANPANDVPDVPENDIVPEGEDVAEVESEWELLEGGKDPKEKMNEDEIDEDNDKTIVRRYEFYEYTGVYDEEHEPLSLFLEDDTLDPVNDLNEVGDFIAANMVGAVLNPIPEPASAGLLVSLGGVMVHRRRR